MATQATDDKSRGLQRQNRWLLNMVWWMAIMLLGELYVFSPIPGLLTRGFVNDNAWMFWPMFWSLYAAFLLLQAPVHAHYLHRYFPQWRRSNRRFAFGVPILAFAGLFGVLVLLMPVSHL